MIGVMLLCCALAIGFLIFGIKRCKEIYLSTAQLPEGLIERVKAKHPHLTPADWIEVEAGLRQFFRLHLKAGRQMVAMPSQVVDDLWHEFILHTRAYQTFCRVGLGRFLHHTPAMVIADAGAQRHAVRRAWKLACDEEGIDSKKPSHLPLLFALDFKLAIVGGFVYHNNCLAARAAGQSHVQCGSDIGNSCSGGCNGGCQGGCGGGGCSSCSSG